MATLNSWALTTLADVKELLGIDAGDTSKDNLIIRMINMATEIIEGYTQRRFTETTYTNEEYWGTGIDQRILRNRPIITFTQIQVRNNADNTDSWTSIPTNEYWVDNNAGVINAIGEFYGSFNRWRATYSAGYATIPSDVAEAAARLAAFMVENGVSGQSIKRKQEGAREVEYHDTTESEKSLIEQLGLDDILDRYREPLLSSQR